MTIPNQTPKKDERYGKCCVCGLVGDLTFEHIPPQSAFNGEAVRTTGLMELLDAERDGARARSSKRPKGVGAHTLCAKCNKDTGSRYVRSYTWWAWQGMRWSHSRPTSLALPYFIFPGRIAKQIICMFGSVCGSSLFEANQGLREFVLNKDRRGIPDKFRIYCGLMKETGFGVRQSGILASLSGGTVHAFAEISFPPFTYILTVDSPPPSKGLFDITFFTYEGYQAFREMHLPMPYVEVHGYFPADFRTKEEWEEALRRPSPIETP